ncbi:MAG: DNA-binding domain-containing protein [Burkholderiales bacterium]
MSELASLQRAFQRHVYRPGRAMEAAVLATARAGAARRLGVYADAYRLRLVEALANDHPALQGLLGEAGFDRMMRAYIAARPSRHANLRWYGGGLARYLSRSRQWRRRPQLAELARFEWALGLAFDAGDAPVTTAEELARIAPEKWPGMQLRLNPSVQLVDLRSNAPQTWRAATTGRRPPAARLAPRPTRWLVWRKQFEPFYRALPADESWALAAAARGHDFAALSAGLRRYSGAANAAQTAAQMLRNWLSEGLICGVDYADKV